MPLKPHPTDPDKMVYVRNEFAPNWDATAIMVEEQQRMAKRIEELEAQLAQPEEEQHKPMHPAIKKMYEDYFDKHFEETSKKREWVGLTDDEVSSFGLFHAVVDEECVRAIEAKLKEKNNG